ncbi:MAG: spermidine/putrescine ABC transporter substrate-binding protein [Actinobacteria bacterium]|nr:spermidine/putrescine ABC transporter substrate-binding protein [Actinomycetota bacterium]
MTRRNLLGTGARVGGATLLAAGAGDLLAACGGSSSSGPATKPVAPAVDGKVLNVLTYPGFFAESAVKGFEKEYGVKVQSTAFVGGQELAKIASRQPFDVTTPIASQLPEIVAAGLARPLDHEKFKYWDQILPAFNNPPYDPGAKYSAPYAFAPCGLIYATDWVKESELTGSWADLWNLAPGLQNRAFVMNDMQTSIGMALEYKGYDLNSGDPKQIEEAGDALVDLMPSTGGLSDPSDEEMVISGQAWLVPSWSNSMYFSLLQVKDRSSLGFQLCDEGSLVNMNPMIVDAAGKSPGTAALFIDWMLKPENMEANVQQVGAGVPTKAGMAAYEGLAREFPFLKLPADVVTSFAGWQKPFSAERRKLFTEQWTRVQAVG